MAFLCRELRNFLQGMSFLQKLFCTDDNLEKLIPVSIQILSLIFVEYMKSVNKQSRVTAQKYNKSGGGGKLITKGIMR